MKKFYEAPVVELTGFSAEDVITTSVTAIPSNTAAADFNDAAGFEAAVKAAYGAADKVDVQQYNSYTW